MNPTVKVVCQFAAYALALAAAVVLAMRSQLDPHVVTLLLGTAVTMPWQNGTTNILPPKGPTP